MLSESIKTENIEYVASDAETFSKNFLQYFEKVDCITCAAALHYFDINSFFIECEKLLKKEGIFVVIGSNSTCILANCFKISEANKDLEDFFKDVSCFYEEKPLEIIKKDYKNVCFPFKDLKRFDFNFLKKTKLIDVINLITTYSGVNKYLVNNKNDEMGFIKKLANNLIKSLNLKNVNDEIEIIKNYYIIANKK
jgi:2-polyprenyl-3-methyl-5-hydroxy-6-metoxy-1,4-benzoquinol methylase